MKSLHHSVSIHKLADVLTDQIGHNTTIWQYSVILPGAKIGSHCNINCHTFIENQVSLGNNVTIKAGVYLWNGLTIEDDVFIGPNVTFTNDRFPRSKMHLKDFDKIFIKRGASIGANSTILGNVTIGCFAMIGASSVVTQSVPDFALVYGSPATIQGWVDMQGNKLIQKGNHLVDNAGLKYKVENNTLIPA